jgi:hypothetical protein
MKKIIVAGVAGLAVTFGSAALAEDAKPAAAPSAAAPAAAKLSVETTPIADIAASAEGKAVLDKHFPGMTTHAAYDQFKGMSIKQVQPMSQGAITDEAVAATQADLDKLVK